MGYQKKQLKDRAAVSAAFSLSGASREIRNYMAGRDRFYYYGTSRDLLPPFLWG
jgi:hypothetical protein